MLPKGRLTSADVPYEVWRAAYDEYERCMDECDHQREEKVDSCVEEFPTPPNSNIPASRACTGGALEVMFVCHDVCSALHQLRLFAYFDPTLEQWADGLRDALLGLEDAAADRRQRAKRLAGQLSVTMNDLAVFFGAEGVVAGAGGALLGIPFAGLGVGLTLGLMSFGAWFLGNRATELTLDPPRNDYRVGTYHSAAIPPKPSDADEFSTAWERSAVQCAQLGLALRAFVQSVERLDGLTQAENLDARNLVIYSHRQLAAIRHNGVIVRHMLAEIVLGSTYLDRYWQEMIRVMDEGQSVIRDLDATVLEEEITTAWRAEETTWVETLGLTATDARDFRRMAMNWISEPMSVTTLATDLIDSLRRDLEVFSAELRELLAIYANAKITP